MSVARHQGVVRAFALLGSLFLMSCLVTNKIEPVVEANLPPSIVSAPDAEFPLNEIIRLNRDDVAGELELAVIIRDANVDQTLQIQVFVDYVDNPLTALVPQPPDNEVAGTGTFERSVTIRIPVDRLGDPGRCHRVELDVSTEFERFQREPVESGDSHTATWWVSLTDSEFPSVDMGTCPQ